MRCTSRIYVWLYSTGYRAWSRVIHRFGFHYAPLKTMHDGSHSAWCQWCGLRGPIITIDDLDRPAPRQDEP